MLVHEEICIFWIWGKITVQIKKKYKSLRRPTYFKIFLFFLWTYYKNLYIYIYIFIIIIKLCLARNFLTLSLSLFISLDIHPCPLFLLLGPPGCIQFQHRANVCKFLLVGQHWHVHVLVSIKEHGLWFRLYFTPLVVAHMFGFFVRWEVGARTAAVLGNIASRICSRQHAAFLLSSYLAFSPCVCVHAVHPNSSMDTAWKKSPFIFFG